MFFGGGGNKSQSRKWHLYRFSHFRTAYPRGSPCFSIGRITPKLPLPIGDLDPHITYGFLGPHESAPKRHLDQFSCFFCRAHECDQQTDTHTNRPCYSICSSYPHLTQCVWCGLTIIASVLLLQPTALLQTGWCHSNFSPVKKSAPPPVIWPLVKILVV